MAAVHGNRVDAHIRGTRGDPACLHGAHRRAAASDPGGERMTDTRLAEACALIAECLPVALQLVTEPDADGTTGTGQPSSRPPWNQAAASAAMDAHEGLRRLEASLRLAVTGHTGPRRGGSDASTAVQPSPRSRRSDSSRRHRARHGAGRENPRRVVAADPGTARRRPGRAMAAHRRDLPVLRVRHAPRPASRSGEVTSSRRYLARAATATASTRPTTSTYHASPETPSSAGTTGSVT